MRAISNQKNKWHHAAQFNQCTSFCSEALRNEKVQLQKTLDKVAAIAIHSKAAQCVFTLNRAGENLVWFVDPLLGASIPTDIKYVQYAHPSCPFWYSFKAVQISRGKKAVSNLIVLGWKFRPSHCWQQSILQSPCWQQAILPGHWWQQATLPSHCWQQAILQSPCWQQIIF